MTPLDIALSYTARDWPVFPCRHKDEDAVDHATGQARHDPETGEVEVLKVKTPITSNGFKGATRLERIIQRWWTDHPDAMIGVPTGAQIGAWVLDIDPRHGGDDTLAQMEEDYEPLPATLSATTASGGRHYYFQHISGVRNRGNLGPGVDVRGDGGYVIAPGSVTAAGGRYEWDNDLDPAPAPQWLLDLVMRRVEPVTVIAPSGAVTNSAYVNAAVDRELADLAAAQMGNRNNALNDAAFSLGQFVGAGALPESEARALLQDVARAWGRDWARCVKTIDNGLSAGVRQPRQIPRPNYENDNTTLLHIQKMIENGKRKAESRAGGAENEHGAGASEGQQEIGPPPALHATPFEWVDPAKLPRREFAFGTHYIRKYVSVTVAPGGLGKTANSVVEALAMVSAKPLAGVKPSERLRVWLFNSEDPRDELQRRIMAACLRYKLKPADLQGRLFLDTGREQELVIAVEDKKSGVRIVEPIVEAVVNQIKANGIDVMIVDPFVSTHQVNENDNGAIDKVAKLWAQIANDTNCAIDIVHHLRKLAEREATVEDARGAVSLIGAARSVRVLNRMSATQAEEAGIPANDRYGYFSIHHGKANLAPLSHRLDWRRLDGVPLGNGRGPMAPQDFAPVVVEYEWPSPEAVVEGVADDALVAIKKRIGGGDYRESEQAKQWAGLVVADVLGLDVDNKGDKRRVKTMLKKWEKDGHFTTEMRKDEKFVSRKCLVPVWGETVS